MVEIEDPCCNDPDPSWDETYTDNPLLVIAYGSCRNCGKKIQTKYEATDIKER